jgi:hypothetical protein
MHSFLIGNCDWANESMAGNYPSFIIGANLFLPIVKELTILVLFCQQHLYP